MPDNANSTRAFLDQLREATDAELDDRLSHVLESLFNLRFRLASGQIEGGILQSLGYALCEEMAYDKDGQPRETDFIGYHLMRSDEMPEIQSIFVETYEPSHPYGVKSVGEVVLNPTAPAIGNAVANAAGVHVDHLPLTPERLWRAMKA